MRFDGIRMLVTGGASGLGRAVALHFTQRGAHVVIFDLPDSDGARTAHDCGSRATFVGGDVRSEADVRRAVDAAGELRVLVNCAGVFAAARILQRGEPHPLSDFERIVEVNLVGTFNTMRLAAAAMAKLDPIDEDRGVIVNTASIAAYEGQIGQAAYAASKAGIAGMTISAARDLAEHRIRVCAIAPGVFDTPMFSALSDSARAAIVALTADQEGRVG